MQGKGEGEINMSFIGSNWDEPNYSYLELTEKQTITILEHIYSAVKNNPERFKKWLAYDLSGLTPRAMIHRLDCEWKDYEEAKE